MHFRELNRANCKTYLIGCDQSHKAALIDPIKERVDRYLAILAYYGYKLEYVIETHTHADHRTAAWDLRDLAGAQVVMHRRAPAPRIDVHIDDNQHVKVGDIDLIVRHTPGHTPDSISICCDGRVFTGDTLLIHGTGRADFAGGDPGAQYDSITSKLFTLPDDTIVFPAHDYRGHSCSTIGEEKRTNPRVAGHTRDAYIDLMNNLGLPLPEKIQEALQSNQSAIEDESVKFPSLMQLSQVRQVTAQEVEAQLADASRPVLLDVREVDEFSGELGHIPGAVLIPLKELPGRLGDLAVSKDRSIVTICRSGVRSTTAAAILTGLGYEHVSNMRGGMIDWNDAGLGVER